MQAQNDATLLRLQSSKELLSEQVTQELSTKRSTTIPFGSQLLTLFKVCTCAYVLDCRA